MKKIATTLTAAAFAAFSLGAVAHADDLEAHCVAYADENGSDSSGCACLAEAADADMTAELMAVAAESDLEGLSDGAKEAIAACFPSA